MDNNDESKRESIGPGVGTVLGLIRRRAGYRGVITRLGTDFDDFITAASQDELEARLGTLEGTHIKIQTLDDEILGGLTEASAINGECLEIAAREEQILGLCAKIRLALKVFIKPTVQKPGRSDYNEHVKLPKLSLPRFGGKLTEWLAFWEVFQSAVHNSTSLDPVHKFFYLRGQVDGEAQMLIEGFAVTGDSYDKAVQLLQSTYGDKEQLKIAHVLALLSMKDSTMKSDDLSKFRADMECHTRSLDALGLTLEEMIVIILRQKLPLTILDKVRSFELEEFKTGLGKEIVNLQLNKSGTSSSQMGKSENGWEGSGTLNMTVGTKSKGNGKGRTQVACKFCNANSHKWSFCSKYQSNEARIARAKKLELCASCLGSDHGRNGKCTAKFLRPCRGCTGHHFDKLCPKASSAKSGTGTTSTTKDTGNVSAFNLDTKKDATVLPTVQIPMIGKHNKVFCRVLLDQGSQRSFILKARLDELEHSIVGAENLQLQGFTGTLERQSYPVAQVSYIYRKNRYYFTCIVVDVLPEYQTAIGAKGIERALRRKGYKISDPVSDSKTVDILLGADHYYSVVHSGYKRECGVVILPTKFGYCLSGRVVSPQSEALVDTVSVLRINNINTIGVCEDVARCDSQSKTEFDLERLWRLDHIGINPEELNMEAKLALEQFESTVTYNPTKAQYEVGLPWKDQAVSLPTNFGLALGRLRSLQRKLAQDPVAFHHYDTVIKDYVSRGFIEKIDVDDYSALGRVHYLAHHGVKKESVTTPVRIVYDCSARAGKGPSLNDCLLTGPSYVADLSQQLLRFRLGKFACTSDIEKAFLMVGLREEDRNVTRFLWLTDVNDPQCPVVGYRFCVVLFGATCSQFLLNATIKKHLEGAAEETGKLSRGLYIDNLQITCDSEEELLEYYWQARRLFMGAHLNLREWVTNSPSLRTHLDVDGTGALRQDETKNLGMVWSPSDDTLGYPQRDFLEVSTHTKRSFLSEIAKLFDPLGFLIPVTIRARLMMQEVWRRDIGWDDPLPADLAVSGTELFHDYNSLSHLRIPRRVSGYGSIVLHCFCDASTVAYGVAVYVATSEGTELLVARAKVAPVKGLTVPKMELTAMLLSARLINHIMIAFKGEIIVNSTHVWSDSKVALNWLHSSKVLPVYVRNRVDQVRSLIPGAIYHYISTVDNPSDLVTRGITASQLKGSTLWWRGPTWLTHDGVWPIWEPAGAEGPAPETVSVVPLPTQLPDSFVEWSRIGKFNKLIRVVAWVKRFCNNALNKLHNKDCNMSHTIDAVEMKAAEVALIRLVQAESYPDVLAFLSNSGSTTKIPNIVRQLNLRLDKGLIRCQGRLKESNVSSETNCPLLMPANHHVTDLLIIYEHECIQHFGVHHVVTKLRQKWWVPSIRQVVRKILKKCVKCLRLKGKPYTTGPPPPLPECRVEDTDPFQNVGLDYTGALRTREQDKVYILLFTCATTRAVHLELCESMSHEDFLLAFRRFCARRSFPKLIISDNAPTFLQASNYLKELSQDPNVITFLGQKRCEWRTIPVNAPWFGGMWERCVGIVKAGLKAVVGRALLSKCELSTVLTEVEATVNSRPLTYVYTDLDEPLPLTPAHLLYGRSLTTFPSDNLTDDEMIDPSVNTSSSVTKRYRYISKLIADFRVRWTNDYLVALRERSSKRHGKASAPSVGDVVLIKSDHPRLMWKLGEIMKIHEGQDSVERVASVRTANGVAIRPIAKLYNLELHDMAPSADEPEERNADTSNEIPVDDATPRVKPQSRRAATAALDMLRGKIASGQL